MTLEEAREAWESEGQGPNRCSDFFWNAALNAAAGVCEEVANDLSGGASSGPTRVAQRRILALSTKEGDDRG